MKRDNYAFYRFPRDTRYFAMRQNGGNPETVYSCEDLNNKSGFVLAPFNISEPNPIYILKPEALEYSEIPDVETDTEPVESSDGESGRKTYGSDFKAFHECLVTGKFSKLVLARCSQEIVDKPIEPERLFFRACKLYPRMFIALVSVDGAGTWLMASPETLLEGDGTHWRTVALAGTMKLDGDSIAFDTPGSLLTEKDMKWTGKNLQEQQYVATYIRGILSRFSSSLSETEPFTARAGRLVHLRSNFDFTLKDNSLVGSLLRELYPTPAVCGTPKKDALRFILANEHCERKYYSGFAGPMNIEGKTSLYVTLRCMQINGNEYNLYAGGGILKESEEQSEWNETEAKMETMRKCLAIKKI